MVETAISYRTGESLARSAGWFAPQWETIGALLFEGQMPKYPTIADDLQSLAMPISALVPDPKNARKHSIRNIDAIKGSLAMFGQRKPIVVNESNGTLIVTAGNGTLEAARELGWTHLAVVRTKDDLLTSTGYALADNRTAELAEWDDDGLAAALAGLQDAGWGLDGLGFDDEFVAGVLGADNPDVNDPVTVDDVTPATLAERFLVPPFSILDARQGYWQERKRQWLSIGIQSELGRGGAPGGNPRPATRLTESGHTIRGDGTGQPLCKV